MARIRIWILIFWINYSNIRCNTDPFSASLFLWCSVLPLREDSHFSLFRLLFWSTSVVQPPWILNENRPRHNHETKHFQSFWQCSWTGTFSEIRETFPGHFIFVSRPTEKLLSLVWLCPSQLAQMFRWQLNKRFLWLVACLTHKQNNFTMAMLSTIGIPSSQSTSRRGSFLINGQRIFKASNLAKFPI